jgi:hypothetical protein
MWRAKIRWAKLHQYAAFWVDNIYDQYLLRCRKSMSISYARKDSQETLRAKVERISMEGFVYNWGVASPETARDIVLARR